jgi:3-mercaptopyruvate sulfurtransferase SseA
MQRSVRYSLIVFGVLALSPLLGFAQEGEFDILAETQQIEYPRITVEELKQLIDSKATDDILIVDNAPKELYDEGHIPGAVSFPWANQIKPPIKLPRNKTLIMYCPCTAEEDSTDMANKLRMFGYRNIKLLAGGWFKWEELKYPIEKSTEN